MVIVPPVNWFKLANIPKWHNIYCRDLAVAASDDKNKIYLAASVINKNKNPERYEIIILRAENGQIALIERLIRGKEYSGQNGAVALAILPNNQLHLNVTINIPEAPAMYTPHGLIIDGNVVYPPGYNA